jgi:hypothetical protein
MVLKRNLLPENDTGQVKAVKQGKATCRKVVEKYLF